MIKLFIRNFVSRQGYSKATENVVGIQDDNVEEVIFDASVEIAEEKDEDFRFFIIEEEDEEGRLFKVKDTQKQPKNSKTLWSYRTTLMMR